MANDARREAPGDVVADVAGEAAALDVLRGGGADPADAGTREGGDPGRGEPFGDHPDGGGGDAPPGAGPGSGGDRGPESAGSGDGAGDLLDLREPDSESGSDGETPDPSPEDLAAIRRTSTRQATAGREAASAEAEVAVRKEVRRILGLDGRVDFEAESVQHVMGLTRDGERVDPELEKELRAELDALGIDLDVVKLRYETMSEDDRRQLTTFEVQQAFLRVVERVDSLATQASVSLGHRIGMFERESKDYLKLFAGLRVLLDAEGERVEQMLGGVRERLQEEKVHLEALVKRVGDERDQLRDLLEESPQTIAQAAKKKLDEQVLALEKGFEQAGGHLKSCENRVHAIIERLGSAGAAATAVEQEAARVMTELQRVAGAGFAVRRLALLGGVIGSAVGGFFAFVVLLLLWAATGGS